MRLGTVLSDRETGLKLLVVEEAARGNPAAVSLGDRNLVEERVVPAVPQIGGRLTTDPGMRG